MWVRAYGEPFYEKDGEIREIYGIFQDISNFVEREKLLELAKRELSDIVTATKLGLWKWDIVHNELKWADNMYSLYSLSKDDFSGDYDAWLSSIHPDDKERLDTEVEQALAGVKDFDTTFRVRTGSNEIRYIKAIATIERDKNDQPLFMSGINIDRTEEKLLELSVAEERKRNITQSRLASIGELAAGVGHEINNPLAIAVGSLSSLKRELGGLLEENKYYSNIKKAHKRIKKITDGLREFSRDDKDYVPVDISKTLVDSVNFVKQIFNSAGIKLTVEVLTTSDYFVAGVKSELQQVFMNLLSNAKDAIEDQERKEIYVSITEKGENIKIEFRDTGAGIPSEIQDKVFDNFFTSKDVGKGTGIGLALVQQIVTRHQGEIYFETKSGVGTSFFLELPISKVTPNKEAKIVAQALGTFDMQISVLVVDDEEMLREILEEMLNDLGAKVTLAKTGQEALELIKKNKYDIVISDIQMPYYSGRDLLHDLRENELLDETKFVFITGGVQRMDDIAKICDGIIHKPFVRKDIFEALNKLIRNS
jgi:signal transduction histidine kinase